VPGSFHDFLTLYNSPVGLVVEEVVIGRVLKVIPFVYLIEVNVLSI